MIDLCYRLALALLCVAMDNDKFLLTISLCPVLIQLSSQINYHLDKLSPSHKVTTTCNNRMCWLAIEDIGLDPFFCFKN